LALKPVFTAPKVAAQPVQSPGGLKPVFTGSVGPTTGLKSVFTQAAAPEPPKTVGGFLGNVLGDVREIVGGISSLVGMGIHDIGEGVKNLIPGEQSGEEAGYQYAALGRAINPFQPGGGAIAQDYVRRYGSWHGFFQSLYDDPLSFVGDALIVGAAGAKAAQLGGKLGILSEEAVAAVRGSGVGEYASLTKGAIPTEVSLSANPVRRIAQVAKWRLSSTSAEEAAKWLEVTAHDTPARMRGSDAIQLASNKGLRVLRPGISKALEGRYTSKALSLAGLRSSDWTQAARNDVKKIVDSSVDDPEMFLERLQGTGADLDAPTMSSPTTFKTPYDVDVIPDPTSPLPPQNATRILSRTFKMKSEVDQFGTTHIEIGNMDEAPSVLEQAAQKLGAKIEGVKNSFGDITDPYSEYRGALRLSDGTIMHVSIGTPELRAGQRAADIFLKKATELANERATLEGISVEGIIGSKEAQRLLELNQDLKAIDPIIRQQFIAPNRMYNSVVEGVAYDGNTLAADRIRPIVARYATGPEMDLRGLRPHEIMNRAFGPQRIYRYDMAMMRIKDDLTTALAAGQPEQMWPILENFFGANHPEVIRALGSPLRKDPIKAVDQLIARLRNGTWDEIAIQGDHPTFTWDKMLADTVKAEGQIPQYYPHIRTGGIPYDAWITKGAQIKLGGGDIARTRRWMGHLYESGNFERDPMKAYSTLFRQVAAHKEFTGLSQDLIDTFGRKVSQEEILNWIGNKDSGERLVSRSGIKRVLDERAQIISDTQMGLMSGKSMDQATIDAIRALDERIVNKDFPLSMMDDVYAIPKHVADQLDMQAKRYFGGSISLTYDKAMGMWKTAVLSLSPRWVMNNFFGNMYYIGVENPAAIRQFLAQLMPSRRAYAKNILGEAFNADLERTFMHAETLPRIEAGTGSAVSKVGAAVSRSVPGKITRATSHFIRNLNVYIEDAARRGVAIAEIDKASLSGFTRYFHGTYKALESISREGTPSGAKLTSILTQIDRTLGDYLTMSPIEKNIIRPYIFPFYGFYRHTARFLARMPFDHPIKSQLLTTINQVDKDLEGSVPDWLHGNAALWQSGPETFFLRMTQTNPLQQVAGMGPKEPLFLGTMNPLIRMAIESQTGVSTYTGEAFMPPPGQIVETASGEQYQILRDSDGNFAGVKAISGNWLPPLEDRILSMVPQFALLPGVDIFGRSIGKKLIGMAGVSYSSFDLEKFRQQQIRDQVEALSRGASSYARNP